MGNMGHLKQSHCVHAIRFGTLTRMSNKGTRWWRRISALAELHGDHDQKSMAETLNVSGGTISAWKNKGHPAQR